MEYLYIVRVSDLQMLAASTESATTVPPSNSAQGGGSGGVISNLRARGTAQAPQQSTGGGRDQSEGRQLLLTLNASSPPRMSIDGIHLTYHYAITPPLLCFLATDKQYPKKLAFVYLEEVRKLFLDHVAREHPNVDPLRTIAASDRPYAFIKFDRELRNLRRDFADPSSKQNIQRVHDNLNEIQSIMRTNIDALLQRGDDLNSIRNVSQKLHEDSKNLAWGAKKLNHMAWLRRVGPFVGAGLVVLFFLWVRFFVM